MFQQRHFHVIAAIIKDLNVSDETRKQIAKDFGDKLHTDNPKFKREFFERACGVSQ